MNAKPTDGHPVELLSSYVDGELDAAERSSIERHLAGCEGCRAILTDLRIISRAVDRDDDVPDVPAGLAKEISRRIARDAAGTRPRSWIGSRPWVLAAAASVMLVAVVSVLLRSELATLPARKNEIARAEPVERKAGSERAASADEVVAPPDRPAGVDLADDGERGAAPEPDPLAPLSAGRMTPSTGERRDSEREGAKEPVEEQVLAKDEERKTAASKSVATAGTAGDERMREEFAAAPDAAGAYEVTRRESDATPGAPAQEQRRQAEGRLAAREKALESTATQRRAFDASASACTTISILPDDAVSDWYAERDEDVRRELAQVAARLGGTAHEREGGAMDVTVPADRWDEFRTWYAAARKPDGDGLPPLAEHAAESDACVQATFRVAPRPR